MAVVLKTICETPGIHHYQRVKPIKIPWKTTVFPWFSGFSLVPTFIPSQSLFMALSLCTLAFDGGLIGLEIFNRPAEILMVHGCPSHVVHVTFSVGRCHFFCWRNNGILCWQTMTSSQYLPSIPLFYTLNFQKKKLEIPPDKICNPNSTQPHLPQASSCPNFPHWSCQSWAKPCLPLVWPHPTIIFTMSSTPPPE